MPLNTCILIKTTPVDAEDVLQKTRKVKGVRKAFLGYGRYDIIAFGDGPSYPEIRKISELINEIKGVRSTETLVEG
ncbi:MAG: Lrp/AsnC family transcriptional regulator [Nitrososphaerota archaeon]|nr:Lrp/AsnC family transcriptional regulator [Nitrososphaerota archaeon]MDG6966309.1 Lrp/AsnC family transcriptional regulator [Nitrososphaerota archaeon]MDG6977744.1 Lrp/AsnC family transcriptional regulator [Nitrososphaerota archaeon]MDG7005919.1 Lrp/AsnC family transcriptional regulator [Nitrososphaerota archaeon]MDG7021424.1 Lrp/AsnC family transcriptional regulator [Nitrososphaerota archaeon]